MSARPQFSLRWLMFVMALLGMAAATIVELPEEKKLAFVTQGLVRVALCVAFPAMLLAGAVSARGYVRSMCIGGFVAAAVPLVTVFAAVYGAFAHLFLKTFAQRLHDIFLGLWFLRRLLAVLWALIPCASFACLSLHWLWREHEPTREKKTTLSASTVIRIALTALAAFCAAMAAVYKVRGVGLIVDTQNLLMIALTVVFPSLLAVGAVQASGYWRTFCVGGAFSATFALVLICTRLFGYVAGFDSPTPWSIVLVCLTQERLSTAALWASASLFGLACVLFHWLFVLCGVKRHDHSDPAD
jgi:hypothetical protein